MAIAWVAEEQNALIRVAQYGYLSCLVGERCLSYASTYICFVCVSSPSKIWCEILTRLRGSRGINVVMLFLRKICPIRFHPFRFCRYLLHRW